jgi:hypothetical protein
LTASDPDHKDILRYIVFRAWLARRQQQTAATITTPVLVNDTITSRHESLLNGGPSLGDDDRPSRLVLPGSVPTLAVVPSAPDFIEEIVVGSDGLVHEILAGDKLRLRSLTLIDASGWDYEHGGVIRRVASLLRRVKEFPEIFAELRHLTVTFNTAFYPFGELAELIPLLANLRSFTFRSHYIGRSSDRHVAIEALKAEKAHFQTMLRALFSLPHLDKIALHWLSDFESDLVFGTLQSIREDANFQGFDVNKLVFEDIFSDRDRRRIAAFKDGK